MIHTPFDYKAPRNLKKAIELLTSGNALVIAGGTSLMNAIRTNRVNPSILVDIKNIKDVKGMSWKKVEGILVIRSITTLSEIADSTKIVKSFPLLAEAINSINDPQYKNRATIGGCLAFNDPGADITAAILALNASISVSSKDGIRSIPADSFFTGKFKTSLQPSEIIISIDIPLPLSSTKSTYLKIKNQANESAICGIAIVAEKTKEGIVRNCRITITGATDCTKRLENVEAAINGRSLTKEDISEALAKIKSESLTFISDIAASSDYREHLAHVLTERAIIQIAGN